VNAAARAIGEAKGVQKRIPYQSSPTAQAFAATMETPEVRANAAMTEYYAVVGKLLKVVQDHGDFLRHVAPAEIVALTTPADLSKERAAAPLLDFFARLGQTRGNGAGLRAVK